MLFERIKSNVFQNLFYFVYFSNTSNIETSYKYLIPIIECVISTTKYAHKGERWNAYCITQLFCCRMANRGSYYGSGGSPEPGPLNSGGLIIS